MESFVSNIVGREVDLVQALCLLSHACTDVLDTGILHVIVPHIQDLKGMVSTEDGAQMLTVLRAQVVTPQPQLLQVLIELHGSHFIYITRPERERGGGGGGGGERGREREGEI